MKINLNEKRQISADAIMKDVLKHIDDIFSIKGLEIYFGEYITESFEAHMKSENSIVVTYLGKDIIVPLRENIRKLSRELLARYVMQGFAKLYLNKTESKGINKKNALNEEHYEEEYAVCVFEKDDMGNDGDRVITAGSKQYCEDWVKGYNRLYGNYGMHRIKPVDKVENINFQRDYFGKNRGEDDFDDLADMMDNAGFTISRRDVFGENKRYKKNTIRLTESDLKRVISESVRDILKEESYRKSAKKGDKTSTVTKRELNYKKKNGEKDAPRKFHQYAKHNNLDKTAPYGDALCKWEDARNAMNESNEMFNEKEIDYYINMRASSNKKMQDIKIKYKHLYGSMIFDYPDLSSFFDAMIAQGEEIPVKDMETYESAKMMNQKANKILFQYKEKLKSQKPSPKEELLSGEEWQYHDLYNRI